MICSDNNDETFQGFIKEFEDNIGNLFSLDDLKPHVVCQHQKVSPSTTNMLVCEDICRCFHSLIDNESIDDKKIIDIFTAHTSQFNKEDPDALTRILKDNINKLMVDIVASTLNHIDEK